MHESQSSVAPCLCRPCLCTGCADWNGCRIEQRWWRRRCRLWQQWKRRCRCRWRWRSQLPSTPSSGTDGRQLLRMCRDGESAVDWFFATDHRPPTRTTAARDCHSGSGTSPPLSTATATEARAMRADGGGSRGSSGVPAGGGDGSELTCSRPVRRCRRRQWLHESRAAVVAASVSAVAAVEASVSVSVAVAIPTALDTVIWHRRQTATAHVQRWRKCCRLVLCHRPPTTDTDDSCTRLSQRQRDQSSVVDGNSH